ncbi:MAG TPA: hypothetical protein PKZ76_03345 [Xanthomonadaceae bacterium]|nr:hypothetical protein [Xanthomonadaceae bacterium]
MSRKSAPRKSAKPTPPKADTPAKADAVAPPASSDQAAPSPRKAKRSLSPAAPAGYKPQGKVRTLSEKGGVRVLSDDVRVWKEQA